MRVESGGVGIEYEVTGDGRPVVLLHGFPDSGRLWRHQVPALAEAGFKVIVPNLRGYGRSDKPAEVEAYAMQALVGDVVGVMHDAGAPKAHVVGHDPAHRVCLDLRRLVRASVTAQIRDDHLEAGLGQRGHLVTPEPPRVGKAVKQHDRPTVARDLIFDSDAARVNAHSGPLWLSVS